MGHDSRRLGGTSQNPVRVDLPCAWYGKDLQSDDSWIWLIRPEHVTELDAALAHSKASGRAEQAVTPTTFLWTALQPSSQICCTSLSMGVALC